MTLASSGSDTTWRPLRAVTLDLWGTLIDSRDPIGKIERRREMLLTAINSAGYPCEVEQLRAAGFAPPMRSQQAIGYAELHELAAGRVDRPRAVELIKRNSRHYARRQLSWYRSASALPEVSWHPDPADVDLVDLERYQAGL